jgi:3'-5' exoribonuclease
MQTGTSERPSRPTVNVTHAPLGERVQEPFVVVAVDHRGIDEPFTVFILGNRTGRIETAPFWLKDLPRVTGIAKGDVVQVIGEIASYHDRRQLKVSSLRVLPKDMVDWSTLLPSIGDTGPYWDAVDRWRSKIVRPRLRAVLDLFFTDPEFRQRFETCPASLNEHHSALGGVLLHTVEVARIARTIARVCHAEVDVTVAGALLHDIGKTEAYRWSGAFDVSERGALHGPSVLGADLLAQRVRSVTTPPCTEHELALLQHLVLAQADTRPHRSPVVPATLEALVIHHADRASAHTAGLAEAPRLGTGGPDDLLIPVANIRGPDGQQMFRSASDWGATGPHEPNTKEGRPSGS